MKHTLNSLFNRRSGLVLAAILFVNVANCQTPCDPGGDPDTDPNIPCPIDGGLSLLIAAGIGIGAKKAYNDRKRKNTASL